MSEDNIKIKDYSKLSNRVLNRVIKIRSKQIAAAELGYNSTDKSLGQLKYELEAMTTSLLERAMVK